MTCRHARKLLVAWQDGELSPSRAAQVELHLDECPACSEQEHRLAAVTPAPHFDVPTRVRVELARAVEEAVRREAANPAPPQPTRRSWRDWLAIARPMPVGLGVAYAALLAISAGWGMHNYLEARQLEARLERGAPPEAQALVSSEARRQVAEPWRSPAYTPSDHWF